MCIKLQHKNWESSSARAASKQNKVVWVFEDWLRAFLFFKMDGLESRRRNCSKMENQRRCWRKISWKNTKAAPFKSQWPHSMPFWIAGQERGARKPPFFNIWAVFWKTRCMSAIEMETLDLRKSEPGWLNLLAANTMTAERRKPLRKSAFAATRRVRLLLASVLPRS